MDIRIRTSGQIFYQFDGQVAAVLIASFPDMFEKYERPPEPPRPLVPEWTIGKNMSDRMYIQLRKPVTGETVRFLGDPTRAAAAFAADGFQIPDHVVAAYQEQFNGPYYPVYVEAK